MHRVRTRACKDAEGTGQLWSEMEHTVLTIMHDTDSRKKEISVLDFEINKPFDLYGPKNVRELGGYPTADGHHTREHVFLRADGLDTLTAKDRRFLRQYPIALVVDLRSKIETRLAPDHLDRHFKQLHVPMFDHVQSELARRRSEGLASGAPVRESLTDIYIMLAETEQDEIYHVLKALIDSDEPALFHCTAGKDRTGIISMCLLEMAGVPEEIILADYAATARYLGKAYGFAASDQDGVPSDAFDSRPEIMQTLREHMKQKYGSVLGYIRHIGISDEDIDKLKGKFVE